MSTTTRGGGADAASTPREPAVQRLLDAARDAFAEKGYHGTSTREIATRAGMSPAAMYVHFESKQDILLHLTTAGHTAALAVLEEASASPGSPTKRLRAAVYAFAYWHAEHHTTARIVQHEWHALSEQCRAEVTKLRHRTVATVRDIIAAGVRTGEFAVDNIDTTTLAVLSLCIDTMRWYPSRELHTPASVGSAFASLAERMVKASD
ncbi:transcriptional regulator, TetR family [Nocardia amikacinitolerans]|uniref:Transcriptional regulator, TetR family n=1 Tax=Nocardia amikacinitolerans TaxID=756689 RepID=A0A285LYG2_9NOCA|nr:TetR family transcriptional regulator [Nocardia amikacinitolerans]MCP2279598.1 transcriptional regulator, TetR family [Nocardia amikacinitolerans]MCP2298612.1 transcriptional regulator, TetR family [Nocardia amikacinitolerans]SNY89503.1 transcriptional regulator, TetR family [Nocardia amikacinitolerans]